MSRFNTNKMCEKCGARATVRVPDARWWKPWLYHYYCGQCAAEWQRNALRDAVKAGR